MVTHKSLSGRLPSLGLVLVAVIWGGGFIATQALLDNGITPEQLLAARFLVGAAAMLGILNRKLFPLSRKELVRGAVTGLFLFMGFYAQTLGLRITTPSNNGFFTACNVMMVPFIAWALHRKRPPVKVFACCLLALAGFFVLSSQPGGGFAVNAGDMLTLLCAFFFACHIAVTGLFAPDMDAGKFSFLQIGFAAVFSTIAAAAGGGALPAVSLGGVILPALYLGVLSTCLAFFLQTWAQRKMNSGKATVIMSTESLWCAAFSVLAGLEPLTWRMALGGLVVVGAVCLLESNIVGSDGPALRNRMRAAKNGVPGSSRPTGI